MSVHCYFNQDLPCLEMLLLYNNINPPPSNGPLVYDTTSSGVEAEYVHILFKSHFSYSVNCFMKQNIGVGSSEQFQERSFISTALKGQERIAEI